MDIYAESEWLVSPAVQMPDSVPVTAQPQQDSTGQIVGWWASNPDGTVTVWDAAGNNPFSTSPTPVGIPVTTSSAGLFSCRPESLICFGWDSSTQSYRMGSPAAAPPGYVPPGTAQLTLSSIGSTISGALGGLASGLGVNPTILWVGLAAVALLAFVGPEVAAASAVSAYGASRGGSRRRRNPSRVIAVGYPGMGRGAPAKYAAKCSECSWESRALWNKAEAERLGREHASVYHSNPRRPRWRQYHPEVLRDPVLYARELDRLRRKRDAARADRRARRGTSRGRLW